MGTVGCFDVVTGEFLWMRNETALPDFTLPTGVLTFASAGMKQEHVLLDARTGNVRAPHRLSADAIGSLGDHAKLAAFMDDRSLVLVSQRRSISILDTLRCELKAVTTASAPICALAADRGGFAVATSAGTVHAHTSRGEPSWRKESKLALVGAVDGRLLLHDEEERVIRAVSLATGEEDRGLLEDVGSGWLALLATAGVVAVRMSDRIIALDRLTLETRWERAIRVDSGVATTADAILEASDGTVTALDPTTGKELSFVETGAPRNNGMLLSGGKIVLPPFGPELGVIVVD